MQQLRKFAKSFLWMAPIHAMEVCEYRLIAPPQSKGEHGRELPASICAEGSRPRHSHRSFRSVGLEAGPLSQAFLKICRNRITGSLHRGAACQSVPQCAGKQDRAQRRARPLHRWRVLFRPVHVKSLENQKRQALLTAARPIAGKDNGHETDIRDLLHILGSSVGS